MTERLQAVIEDIEWLLENGLNGEEIARRLGYRNPASLDRRMRRAGRFDLAQALAIPVWRYRRAVNCVECGRHRPHVARGLCSACWFRWRRAEARAEEVA